jgi:hypothetical protein
MIKINKIRLNLIFNRFVDEPKKIFVKSDFHGSEKYVNHNLEVLISKNMIEEVDAIYKTGVNNSCIRKVMGYRLK